MDCCRYDIDTQMIEKDKQITQDLHSQSIKRSNEIRLLLLGTGESGKSTVMKQLKMIHAGGFGEEEKRTYTSGIHLNIYESINVMIDACSKFDLKITPEHDETVKELQIPHVKISPELGKKISALWKDRAVQKAFELQSQYQLADSAEYYLENVERISAPAFVPTPEDLLRVRIPTTGIKETCFEIDGSTFIVVDVGGQRSERKKWIHCFENVTAVLYCVALSDFDQTLFEDHQTNRLQESLKLFHEVSRSKWFTDTGLILFLNKEDLFRKKLQSGKTIRSAFSEYEGLDDYDNSIDYIQEKFTNVSDPTTQNRRNSYVHITCAMDTENVRMTFNQMREYLIREFGLRSPRIV